jgi:hypothetical protein
VDDGLLIALEGALLGLLAEKNPSPPGMRQRCTALERMPKRFSMSRRTRLIVQRSTPYPAAFGWARSASRSSSICPAAHPAGSASLAQDMRKPSMPDFRKTSRQRYTVCRGAPSARTTSTGLLPPSNSRPARTPRLAASSTLAAMITPRCNADIHRTHRGKKVVMLLGNPL